MNLLVTVARATASAFLALPLTCGGVAVPAFAAEPALTLSNLRATAVTTVTTGVVHTSYRAGTGGPWFVNVLTISPDLAALTVGGTIGAGMSTSQTTTSMLRGVAGRQPYAGINGGFFDNEVAGDMGGISVHNGRVLSEAKKGGTALVLQHGRPYITELGTVLTLRSGTNARELDGINRTPGRSGHCGGAGPGDTYHPGGACTNPSEIVSFTQEYGGPTPKPGTLTNTTTDDDPGVEAVLNADGVVTALHQGRGGRIVPPGGHILQGIGAGAQWLRVNARPSGRLVLGEKVIDLRFKEDLPLGPSLYATAGGDLLVRDAAVVYDGAMKESNPRTAIGADGAGRLLLVTVDGRDPKHSVGATRLEMAQLMKDLGAVDAVNMDGGGSTTMVVRDRIVNQPSDPVSTAVPHGQQRPVADAIFVAPGGYGLHS
ncbi:phosphodiester glycosidase family protein [Nonomuraea sp. NPDC049152]|uniref:phosphodiester glycosidase family protein n=1 Tax=Nonomuraea sp. NPDC049152 TaxID=3154350 RepID=UPI0033F2381F